MRNFFLSTLNRLVLSYGLSLVLVFVTIGLVSVAAFERYVARDTKQTVQAEHEGLMEVYVSDGSQELISTIDARVQSSQNREAVYLLLSQSGQVLAGHRNEQPSTIPHIKGWIRYLRNNSSGEHILAYVQPLSGGGILLTGHTTGEQERVLKLIERLGGLMLLSLVVLTVLLGFLLRRAVDRALKVSLDTVDRVAAGHLSERVPLGYGNDSFDRLSKTLNSMLDRIHELVGGIQASTDAIAHDLRTPLMRLKARLERTKIQLGERTDQQEIDAVINEADQLIATFNSLMRLARIEANNDLPSDPVNLDAVVNDAVEMWQVVAENKNQKIQAYIDRATILGNRDLLFQMASNLFDNAIKYSPEFSVISVHVKVEDKSVLFSISDQGAGISEDQHARVFDRFVRLESHRGTPGTGLGLSLVRAIAIHHNADLSLTTAKPGLVVAIRFNLAPNINSV